MVSLVDIRHGQLLAILAWALCLGEQGDTVVYGESPAYVLVRSASWAIRYMLA